MLRPRPILACLGLALVAIWACDRSMPTADTADGPMLLDGSPCFTPYDTTIAIGETAIFFPTGDCGTPGKRKGTVTWSNPQTPVRGGLGVDPTCAKQVDYRTGTWKVTRCSEGAMWLTVYTDSAGTAVLQTLAIGDDN